MTTKSVQVLAFTIGGAVAVVGCIIGWLYAGAIGGSAGAGGGFVLGMLVVGIIARAMGWKPD